MGISKYFNKDVIILENHYLDNGIGGITEDLQVLAMVKGNLQYINGEEWKSQDKTTLIATHILYIFPTSITKRNVVKIDNKIYEVVAVDNVCGFNKHYQVHLKERD
jgi:SPP1 family predicted phage head-tail adaptor